MTGSLGLKGMGENLCYLLSVLGKAEGLWMLGRREIEKGEGRSGTRTAMDRRLLVIRNGLNSRNTHPWHMVFK